MDTDPTDPSLATCLSMCVRVQFPNDFFFCRTGKSALQIDNSSEQPAVRFTAHRSVRDRIANQGYQPRLKAELDRGLGS